MRLVAAATDPRALPCLERFTEPPHTLLAVLTAPDRPRGRGKAVQPAPLAAWAVGRGILLLQPEDVNAPDVLAQLRALAPEAMPVLAYGQKLGEALLALPRHGCINFHPSLLPRHRGASPIPWTLLAGDAESGACLIRMTGRMDAGPILAVRKEPVLPDDTAETLGERLFALGPALYDTVLDQLADGPLPGLPQDESRATRAPLLTKADGAVDWTLDAAAIARRVRAFQPWPTAYAAFSPEDGRPALRLTLWVARPEEGSGTPGTLLADRPFSVACGRGALALLEVQPEGRRRMPAADFLRGLRGAPGARFLPGTP